MGAEQHGTSIRNSHLIDGRNAAAHQINPVSLSYAGEIFDIGTRRVVPRGSPLRGELKERQRVMYHPDPLQFFVDRKLSRGLDLRLPIVGEMEDYINARLESFVIDPKKRNKQLLEEKPFLTPMLSHRLGLSPAQVTEDQLLTALSDHMVQDRMLYEDSHGVNYLPYLDIAPNDLGFASKRFNWDSEMNLAAVLHSRLPNRMEIAKGSLRNAEFLFDVLGYVPNAGSRDLNDCTQPPRHTTMIRMIADAMTPEERQMPENQQFFKDMWNFARREYWQVFNAKDVDNRLSSEDPLNQNILVDGFMNTIYGSRDIVTYHGVSARGGGWDHSKHAYRREADHTRIDIEMYLHKYEKDFAWEAEQRDAIDEVDFWKARMAKRKERVTDPTRNYDPETGWFYNYDFRNRQRSKVATVTGLFALPLLDDPQEKMRMLTTFEDTYLHTFGVGLTDVETLPVLTDEKAEAIERLEPDHPGMQITLKELYNHEQWEGRKQFYIITKHVRDVLEDAARSETDPQVLEKLVELSNQVTQSTLLGLMQYYDRTEVETGQGTLPEKLEAETGEMAVGAQYGDQPELVMPFGAFLLFKDAYNQNAHDQGEEEIYNARSLAAV